MSETEELDGLAAALVILAQHNVPTDTQELLLRGNPKWDVKPNSLRAALLAERMAERERCAKIADNFVAHKRRVPEDSLVHVLTAADIASSIRNQDKPR